MNTKRENRLEELGRVDAEKAYTSKGKKNLREEKSRIRSELATGGTAARKPTTPEQNRYKRHFRKENARKAGPRAPTRGKPGGRSMGPDYKRKRKPKVITIETGVPKGTRVWGSSDEKIHKKPHATREGSWASIKRASKRFDDKTYKIEDYGDKSLDIQWKAENKARKEKSMKMAKGGKAKKPRPHGPHMWVRGEKRKKYASGGAVMGGKKVGCQIK
jgi:hypothetical protein